MNVNPNEHGDWVERALDADAAWLARLTQAFDSWTAWAMNSNTRQDECVRQSYADRWIELTLLERLLADARASAAGVRAKRARQSRAFLRRCIQRLAFSVAESQGVEAWMHDGLCFLREERGEGDAEAI